LSASERIANEFDRFVALGHIAMAEKPMPERMVYHIVATRCEIDIDGFSSVYKQDLNPDELKILIDGLNRIGEYFLASEFQRGYKLLDEDGFYNHLNWDLVSPSVKSEIEAIGNVIDQQLWSLDEKLVALLDSKS
jgi:hypothetical protein